MSKARTRPLAAFFPFYTYPALKLDLRTSARSPKPPSAVNKLCVQTGLATAFPLTSQLAAKPLQSAGDVIALGHRPPSSMSLRQGRSRFAATPLRRTTTRCSSDGPTHLPRSADYRPRSSAGGNRDQLSDRNGGQFTAPVSVPCASAKLVHLHALIATAKPMV